MKKKSSVKKIYKKKNKSKIYKKTIYCLDGVIGILLVACVIFFGCEFCGNNEMYNKIADFLIGIFSSLAIGCITGLIVYILPKYKKENIDYIEKNLYYLKEFSNNFKLIPKECSGEELESIILSKKDSVSNFIKFMKEKYVSEDINVNFTLDDFETLELFGYVFRDLAEKYNKEKRMVEMCSKFDIPNFYTAVESFLTLKDKIDKEGFVSLNVEERRQLKDSFSVIISKVYWTLDDAIRPLEKMKSKLQD